MSAPLHRGLSRRVVGVALLAMLLLALVGYEAYAVYNANTLLDEAREEQAAAAALKDRAALLENEVVQSWALTRSTEVDPQLLRDGALHLGAMRTFFGDRTDVSDDAMRAAAIRYVALLDRAGIWFRDTQANNRASAETAFALSNGRAAAHSNWVAASSARISALEESRNRTTAVLIGVVGASLLVLVVVLLAMSLRAGRERKEAMDRLRRTAAEMARLASTDPLTGLHNQREFYARLDQDLDERGSKNVALALLDVDDFKRINDRFGHLVGDQVLVEMAARLEHETQDYGAMVARVGGEEFGVVLSGSTPATPRLVAERLRAAMEAPISPVGTVTISVGVAHAAGAENAVSLFRRADQALYAAKHAGKNCVQVAEDTLSLFDEMQEQDGAVETFGALSALVSSVDRAQSMEGHSQRVARVAAALARHAGWQPDRVARLRQAALLHDVGKAAVSPGILSKPRNLTNGEHGEVSTHPALGSEMVRRALDEEQAAWVRHHHERWDGAGYPEGLRGDEIPEGARILAIADAWDAMTTDRLYAPALDERAALAELASCRGTQFWPRGVDLMVRVAHRQPARATRRGGSSVSDHEAVEHAER